MYHYTPINMAKIQNTNITKWWQAQQELALTAAGNAKRCVHFGRQFGVSYKLNIFSLYDPAIELLDIYPNELKIYVYRKKMHMQIYSSFIHICQKVKVTKMSFSKWMYKRWSTQTMED